MKKKSDAEDLLRVVYGWALKPNISPCVVATIAAVAALGGSATEQDVYALLEHYDVGDVGEKIASLVDDGVLLIEGGVIAIARPSQRGFGATPLEREFAAFHTIFAGKKRGAETEFQNFIKKNPDWRTVVPSLRPAHAVEQREHARKSAAGLFCPEYAMMQTWLNQRRWESFNIEVPELAESPAMAAYRAKVVERFGASAVPPLSQEQLALWTGGTGPFAGASRRIPENALIADFWNAHEEYMAMPNGKPCYEILVAKIKNRL